MKVLVAEDDANIRAGLVEILVGEGYQVVAVADGAAALASFRPLALQPWRAVLQLPGPAQL